MNQHILSGKRRNPVTATVTSPPATARIYICSEQQDDHDAESSLRFSSFKCSTSEPNLLHNVKVYVGMTRKDTNRLIGFHPGEIDSTATFALRPNVYVRWIRITKRFPTHYLSLCEVQVEGYQSYVTFKQFVLRGEATNNVRTVRSIAQCAFVCSRDVHCLATQYNETSQSCQAFNTLAVERVSDVTATILVNAYFADQVRNAK
ncbi:hypothetical protein DPMN_011072 [Dreissena polymorpha]|uniref:Apple domain-containing protein n=1 Tax=Dreissena polymorpha TaxID=45954 RepID=A0A9D4N4C2_DREPO|nr:hypothetical protein DPMN_011072 [Dreissena polymorpha]